MLGHGWPRVHSRHRGYRLKSFKRRATLTMNQDQVIFLAERVEINFEYFI